VAAGEVIQELVEGAADRQRFCRPERRTSPGIRPGARANKCKKSGGKLEGVQLELIAEPVSTTVDVSSAERPLFDLFPEAYQ